jgi:hypothetical protein
VFIFPLALSYRLPLPIKQGTGKATIAGKNALLAEMLDLSTVKNNNPQICITIMRGNFSFWKGSGNQYTNCYKLIV